MQERVRVFISSTWANLRREREYIAAVCRDLALEPMYFPENSLAGSNVRDFIARVQESHIVIHVATQPSAFVDAELEAAEALGIPIIELAERQLLADRSGTKVTDEALARRRRSLGFQRDFDTLEELGEAVRTGLSAMLARRFGSVLSVKAFGEDAYDKARLSIQAAHYRLATVQETSTLVLGPRHERQLSERRFLEELQRLIAAVLDGSRDVQVVHVFDGGTTKEALNAKEMYRASEATIAWLLDRADAIEAHEKVTISVSDGPLTATIVADSALEMSTVLGRRYYLWLAEVGGAAHDMWEVIRSMAESPTQPLTTYLRGLAD